MNSSIDYLIGVARRHAEWNKSFLHTHLLPSRHQENSILKAVSTSLPRRLRRRTAAHTPLIPTPLPQPLLSTKLNLPIQLRTRLLAMNEIAKATSHASLARVQPTARFSEIGDGR